MLLLVQKYFLVCSHFYRNTFNIQTMNDLLSKFLSDTISSLEKVSKEGQTSGFIFDIDCSDLKDYLNNNILESEEYSELFNKLCQMQGPVLYWFEILSDNTNDSIIASLKEYKSLKNHRVIPYYKDSYDKLTKTLYVGKCKGKFYGRVIQHLGYFVTPSTQGLQLYHWAKDISLKVRIHAIEFPKEMVDIMPIVEYYFAKHLKPLIGKHI